MAVTKRKRWGRIVLILSGGLVLFLALVVVLANVYVEPVLRKRLQTLVVDGSDSLYAFHLGDLHVNFLGGGIGVHNLQIVVDSNRFYRLKQAKALPSLVMQLNVNSAHIKGIGIFSLLFGKKIVIGEILSQDANIVLNRYPKREDSAAVQAPKLPLWKAIQPQIRDVVVQKIKLDGIKLLYKNSEGREGKLQFDRCDALFENIRIDSAATLDTSRIEYVRSFSLRLNGLKFRTSDSTYKLKAEWITYNSAKRLLEIDRFKLQPTLKNEERNDSMRRSWYTFTFDKVSFNGLRLDRYLQQDRAEADSVVFQNPALSVYQDKKGEKSYESKIGRYPHQLLMQAATLIDMKKFVARNLQIAVTEKDETTREEGTINLNDVNLTVANIVNDPVLLKHNAVSTAEAEGRIIGSPIRASFRFYLDSADGRFDVRGRIGPVSAAQINPISTRMANIEVPSVNITAIEFFVRGQDYDATSDVLMQYSNLSLIFRKRDEATGTNRTRRFLTKILNRYAINSSSTAGGMAVKNVRVARLTTQSFFGIIWKAVFEGMQRIMLSRG